MMENILPNKYENILNLNCINLVYNVYSPVYMFIPVMDILPLYVQFIGGLFLRSEQTHGNV